ncbi:ATP phosphoribosyltransferase regulatory subunit [Tistrella mobilis]|uniref:ATP phosphoribosyltransferase regulatory subunit n=1 Tax=Tistrella mobilis TaxID=171437 RepID=UPI00355636A9
MIDDRQRALLPNGLQDLLPPDAAFEAQTIERLMAHFAAEGYARVKPPLVEFEDSLLTGPGRLLAAQIFRVMDPVSQRMMGVRADMTPQLARIAATRLAHAARPLRLSYAGQVLRVRGGMLRPERQFAQVGIELIGAPEPTADAEVVRLAAEALTDIGVKGLTIDLNLPTMVDVVAEAFGLPVDQLGPLREALDRKDPTAVAELAGAAAPLYAGLLDAAGIAAEALARLDALDLPAEARRLVAMVADVVRVIDLADLDAQVTIDPVEHRGLDYQTGVSFSLFAAGVRGELGSGGRYVAGADQNGGGEPATGFSLYMDSVLRAIDAPVRPRHLYLPFGCGPVAGRAFRADGWITVQGLAPETDPVAEARAQGCSHILRGADAIPLDAIDIRGA